MRPVPLRRLAGAACAAVLTTVPIAVALVLNVGNFLYPAVSCRVRTPGMAN